MNKTITLIVSAFFAVVYGFAAPEFSSSSRRMYTPDPHSMDVVEDDDGIPRIEVRNFTSAAEAAPGFNFSDCLTNGNVNISDMYVLLRTGTGDDRVMKYCLLGKLNTKAFDLLVDEVSVTTNTSTGASDSGVVSVYGFGIADQDGGAVPFKSKQGNVEWTTTPSEADKFLHFDGNTVEWADCDGEGVGPDGITISTNETGHANQLAIKGAFDAANDGKFLKSTGNGTIWADVSGGGAPPDEITVSTNETGHVGQTSVKGWTSASSYSVLMKNDDGTVGWVETKEIEVVVKSEYSTETHQFTNTKKKLRILCPGGEIPEDVTPAETVFTAVQHSVK